MKFKFCLSILSILLFQNCCFKKGEEINRVSFNVEDKAKIPYADDQTVDMVTNEGFQFQLNTNVNNGFSSDQEHCEDYTSYEYYTLNLVSELPTLDIALRLNRNYNGIDDVEFTDVLIEINRLRFYYDIDQPLENLEINGTNYTEVYRYTSGIIDDPISEVFYNLAFGILKINYLNEDYVQIN